MRRPLSRATAILVAALLTAAATTSGPAQALTPPASTSAAAAPGDEPYRPALHFTPRANWMNDPNGLLYADGLWHLYFQHNPEGDRWGNMSWGHATSPDLMHWTEQPLAIPRTLDAQGRSIEDIFSGSAVNDVTNSSGLGTAENPPIVAIYTSAYTDAHPTHAGKQAQSLAYSLDGGQTFTKYAGNPVLDRGSANFRDPKVFRYEGAKGSYWVMVAVEATEHRVVMYRSDDLKSWTHLSDFGPANATTGIWECPDLFPLAVDGDPANTKWVMVVNLNPGAVAGGSGGQYFVGDFDGTTFTSESTVPSTTLPEGTRLAGFDGGTYEGWDVANEPGNWKDGPFGAAPASGSLAGQNPVSGFSGAGLVNGFHDGDWPVGTMTSPPFAVTADTPHLNFLVGGGNHPHVPGTQLANDPPAGTLLFDGFETPDGTNLAEAGWDLTGDFAAEPDRNPSTSGGDFFIGAKRVNTWEGGPRGDDNVGTMTSPTFTLNGDHVSMLVGGGRRADDADQVLQVQLVVDGAVVRHLTGPEAGALNWRSWDVSDLRGREARLRVVDEATGGWGHLTLDHVVVGDEPATVRSEETAVNLVVDGEVVASATGGDSETLDWASFDLRPFAGKQAQVRIVDNNRFGWGHVLGDEFRFGARPAAPRLESYDWLDWGRDYYATVSFNDAPDGRRVMLGWMSNWQYANDTPTSPWRSAMALPREVGLTATPDGPRLVQSVVPEAFALDRADAVWRSGSRSVAGTPQVLPVRGDVVRVDAVIRPGDADRVGLTVLGDGTADGPGTRIGYDTDSGRLSVDRRTSGQVGFHPTFPSVEDVPVPLEDGRLRLSVWVDRASVEVLAQGGTRTVTDLVFPAAGQDHLSLWAQGGTATFESLVVTPLGASMFDVPVDSATTAPGRAVLRASDVSPGAGDRDGAFTVTVHSDKGVQRPTLVRLYQDGVLVARVEPTPTGVRQPVAIPLSRVQNGRHVYTAELLTSKGLTRTGPLVVTVARRR